MCAPIKNYRSYPINNRLDKDEQGRMNRGRDKVVVFYSVLVLLNLLLGYLVFTYSEVLPELDSKIFQALLQVISTILGFGIVTIFYYLGKFEGLKAKFLEALLASKKILSDQQKFVVVNLSKRMNSHKSESNNQTITLLTL